MAIADRAPGISCSLSVCYSVCSCARLGDSGGGESLSENFSKEANALSVERKILSKREDISVVSRLDMCFERSFRQRRSGIGAESSRQTPQ